MKKLTEIVCKKLLIPCLIKRRISKKLLLFISFSIDLSTLLFAQYKFDNPYIIDMDDGLPSNNITTITIDSIGFIWIGTENGLCCWDGITAKIFQPNPSDSNSISGKVVKPKSLLWDETRNKLFIGTENGLSVYDPISGTFNNYYIDIHDSTSLQGTTTSIIKDRQDNIWISTAKGFANFSEHDDNFQVYFFQGGKETPSNTEIEKVNTILDIKQDLSNDSILWIGSSSGLLEFNKYLKKIKRFYFLSSSKNIESKLNVFRSVCPHPNGNLYLGTWTRGMVIFDTKTKKFLKTFRPGKVPEGSALFDGIFPPILVKSSHEIWLSTVQGMSIFDTDKEKIIFTKYFKNEAGKKYPLWLNMIDDQNRLWCGSEYGVYIFDPLRQQFKNFFFDPTSEDKSYITWDIFEDHTTGIIFLAEQNADGLHFFNPTTQEFDFLKLPVGELDEKSVNAITQLSNGDIWIVCQNKIFQLSEDRKTLIPVELDFKDNPLFTDIVEDQNGIIWLSSRNFGLLKVNGKKNNLDEVVDWSNNFNPEHDVPEFRNLFVDCYNRIWFRIYNGGYGYYHPEKDTFVYYNINERAPDNVTCFQAGVDNIIWAGTENGGLGTINPDRPDEGIELKYSENNGLASNYIYKVISDDKNRLWMLTGAGLEMVDPESGESAIFTHNDGIVTFDTYANRHAYIPGIIDKLSDGRMVIGYRHGLGFFHPDSLVLDNEIPLPYITSIKVFEKELKTDTSFFNLKKIKLKYNQNFLSFDYSAILLRPNDRLKFYHQLEGVDRNWVETKHRIASYSNLAPGTYVFKVKSQLGNLYQQQHTTFLEVVILPPWWKTWWAYIIYFVILGSLILGLYRYQLNRLMIQREADQLRELNSFKSQLFTNITHEFRTPLTVILGMVDKIRSGLNPEEFKRFEESLEMIKRNGGNLLHLVNQMLDLSKLESGKLKLQLVQADVIPYLKYITESFQSFADSKSVKLIFYNEVDKVTMDHDPDKLFNIISNLLSNAIKFTPHGGKVIFHVNQTEKNSQKQLIVKVKDTGMGISTEELPNIFNRFYQIDNSMTRRGEGTGIGLSLSKELVELMKGRINVKSQPGEGSEFIVSIPVSTKAPKRKVDYKVKSNIQIPVTQRSQGKEIQASVLDSDQPITLIIEDNQDVAIYIAHCLDKDYRIYFAKDGNEGIEKALEIIPDIIISDVMMPEKDGFEVCATLKQDERTSHIPIIILTAKATHEDKLHGLTCGADAYLSKPFDKRELLLRMGKMVELRKHLLNKYSSRKHRLKSSLSKENIEDVFLKKIICLIEENIDDTGFDSRFLAQTVGMSDSQLYRKLKALTGKSTAIFIRTIRLHIAQELLTSTNLSVSEIAYETGFNDPAWFSRIFKMEFGESPLSFRNK